MLLKDVAIWRWFAAWAGCPCDFLGSHSIDLLLSIQDLVVRFGFSSTGFVLVACMHDGYCQGCTLSMSMWRHWLDGPIQIMCKQHGTHSYSALLCAWRFHRQHLLITKLYVYKPCSNSPLLWLVPRVNWLGYLRLSASTLPASTMWSQAVYSCLSHTLHPLDFNCFLFCASNLSYIPTYKYTTLHSY